NGPLRGAQSTTHPTTPRRTSYGGSRDGRRRSANRPKPGRYGPAVVLVLRPSVAPSIPRRDAAMPSCQVIQYLTLNTRELLNRNLNRNARTETPDRRTARP